MRRRVLPGRREILTLPGYQPRGNEADDARLILARYRIQGRKIRLVWTTFIVLHWFVGS
jgi:hypothetical protein